MLDSKKAFCLFGNSSRRRESPAVPAMTGYTGDLPWIADELPRTYPPPPAFARSFPFPAGEGDRGLRGWGGASSSAAAPPGQTAEASNPASAYFAPPPATSGSRHKAGVAVAEGEAVRSAGGVAASVRFVSTRGDGVENNQPRTQVEGVDSHKNFKQMFTAGASKKEMEGGSEGGGGLRFPAVRHVLWDATPIGVKVHISSHQHAPTLCLTPEITGSLVRRKSKRGQVNKKLPKPLEPSPSDPIP